MDLTKTITYNAFSFAPLTVTPGGAPLRGCTIDDIDISEIDVRQYLDPRALNDGLDAADVFLGGRLVTIQAAVYGTTIGDTYDQLEDALEAFDPVIAYNSSTSTRGFIPLDFYRPTADIVTWPTSSFPNGIPQRINMRPFGTGRYRIGRARTQGESGKGGKIPLTIRAIAIDPRQYLQTQTSITLSTSTQTLTHRGSHPSPPSFTFTLSGAGSSAMAVSVDGFSVKLNLSTVTTGTFTLAFGTRHIQDDSGTSRDDLFDASFTQTFAFVQPHSASFARGFNMTNISSPSFFWREAWL